MKLTKTNTSRQNQTDFSYLLRLSTALESAFGAGVMTADANQQTHEANGWTTEQLLAMSKTKSLFS